MTTTALVIIHVPTFLTSSSNEGYIIFFFLFKQLHDILVGTAVPNPPIVEQILGSYNSEITSSLGGSLEQTR